MEDLRGYKPGVFTSGASSFDNSSSYSVTSVMFVFFSESYARSQSEIGPCPSDAFALGG